MMSKANNDNYSEFTEKIRKIGLTPKEALTQGMTEGADHLYKAATGILLDEKFGEGARDLMEEAATTKDDVLYAELVQKFKSLSKATEEETEKALSMVDELRKERVIRTPITGIMKLYNSGDPDLIRRSKDFIVRTYGKYVFDLIHKNYPTYADKYGDELYNCGCIGLMTAMRGYNVTKGAFTTYCKFFVIHEISTQVNFHRNDSSTYFNGVLRQVTQAKEKLVAQGLEPTVARISMMTDIKTDIVKRELDYIEATRFRYLDADDEKEQACEYDETPEHIVSKKAGTEQLFKSIDKLAKTDPNMRSVVLLKYDGTRTNEEISKQLGITIGQVKTLYTRGLRALRHDEGLRSQYGEYLSDAECEMQKYSVPRVESKAGTESRIDDLENILNLASSFGDETVSESVGIC